MVIINILTNKMTNVNLFSKLVTQGSSSSQNKDPFITKNLPLYNKFRTTFISLPIRMKIFLLTRSINIHSDIADMLQMALLSPQNNFSCFDLPYRLSSWALDSAENGQPWFYDDLLVAWAILQTPFWSLDFVINPSYEEDLLPIILEWDDQKARFVINSSFGRPSWYIQVFSNQFNRISALEQAGYQSQTNVGEGSWSKVLMRRSNNAL